MGRTAIDPERTPSTTRSNTERWREFPVCRDSGVSGEQTLPELHRQVMGALGALAPAFEIIYVEDSGGDGSWSLIAAFARADSRVRGIRMNRNFGQHNAILCGSAPRSTT